MGLDMYLTASKYVGGWSHSNDKSKATFADLVKLTGITPTSDAPSFTIRATVGYWSKANAIHNWFITHCANGDADARDVDVSRNELKQLRADCLRVIGSTNTEDGQLLASTTYHHNGRIEKNFVSGQVITNPEIASAILPTQSGFFFGSTNYDECYLDTLKDTVAIIDRVLGAELDDWYFVYSASW